MVRSGIRLVFLVVASLMTLLAEGAPAMEAGEEADHLVKRLLATPSPQLYAGSSVLAEIASEDRLLGLLLRRWRVPRPEDRTKLLKLLVNLVNNTGARRRTHYRVQDLRVGRVLVDALGDASSAVRTNAASHLEQSCDDRIARFYGPEILGLVKQLSNTDAILLLGRTGLHNARALLEDDLRYGRASRRTTDLALAKLGNEECETKFIDEFRHSRDAHRKARVAADLGYIGSLKACQALAAELRSPETVRRGAKYSLRVIIIDALSKAFPEEPLMWLPERKPKDDGYYVNIEDWAKIVLGASWDNPRPPFFYVLPIPVRPTP